MLSPEKIALQLYTVRTESAKDFAGTLRKVADIGYPAVELAGYGGLAVSEVRAILDDCGLKAPSAHVPLVMFESRLEEALEDAATLGSNYVVMPFLPPDQRDHDHVQAVAALLNLAGSAAKRAGLVLAYHNHAFEFERLGPTGQRPFDVLVESSSEGFFFEIDTYWVVHAGMDLGQLLEKLSGRMPMVHLKDKAVVGSEARMAPIGEGNLDWPHLLPRFAEVGTNLCAVEQDDTYGEDPFDCLKRSYVYLQSLL